MKPLTGADLISKVKEMEGAAKSDLVRACGYVGTSKEGGERLKFTEFYEAVMKAQGLNIAATKAPSGNAPGRKLSYTTCIQSNNNIVIGKTYTLMHNYKPGDEFTIEINENEIKLVKVADPGSLPTVAKRPGRKLKSIAKAVEEEEASSMTDGEMTAEEWNEAEETAAV